MLSFIFTFTLRNDVGGGWSKKKEVVRSQGISGEIVLYNMKKMPLDMKKKNPWPDYDVDED